jgi:poly-gamma-glutamate synthesis protein (capsule biosynthesis protein)
MTTWRPEGFAGEQRPDLRGRPGVNPFRVTTNYVLDTDSFNTQRELALKLSPSQAREQIGEKEFTFLGNKFQTGGAIEVQQLPNELDLKGNLKAVQDASKLADWVVVSFHYHVPTFRIKGGLEAGESTPQFVEDFARACIDAGADAFVGHGPHRDRGLEIYKGKPIFYSLGNFAFQSTLVRRQPQDLMELWGLDVTASAADLYEKREERGRHFFDSDYVWESAFAVADYDGVSGALTGLKLYPVSLGLWEAGNRESSDLWTKWRPLKEVRTKLGRPRPANREL